MKHFFGYVRVSTARQGEHGVSLGQQREAIERYSKKSGLSLSRWFEEQETAAKRGRPVFNQMLRLLKTGHASGVIIHKIDRSARNLKDWADLGELIDAGVDVHFANESLDLHSRGGRLSADIQAVVAADYIRNLREETKKGFYGRLKQGLYPRPAPLGYQNRGKGLAKTIDPVTGPLIRHAFELYGSGKVTFEQLAAEMKGLGLRGKCGAVISASVLSRVLNNPFYMGLIRIAKTGETYPGSHEALVSVALFRRVQDLLRGRVNRRINRHNLLFRQLWKCGHCGRCLIGELQKGLIYYRCHAKGCPSRTAREERLSAAISRKLRHLEFSQEEKTYFRGKIAAMGHSWLKEQHTATAALKLKFSQAGERINRLTDAYLDQVLDKQAFEQRKTALLEERRLIQERIDNVTLRATSISEQLSEIVELAGYAYLAYEHAIPDEKRDLVKVVSSNRTLKGKSLTVTLNAPFQLIADRFAVPCGSPTQRPGRDVSVIWDELLPKIVAALPCDPAPIEAQA